jgi:undecaprenyl-diphosphatase
MTHDGTMSRRLRLPAVPTLPVPSVFDAFDTAVDDWFEAHLRHRRPIDVIMYTASAVADHGMVWTVLSAAQALRSRRAWAAPLTRSVVGLGVESAVVNGPVKWLFRRTRPIHEGPRPLHLRTPRSSSFPSGHSSAAFFGAALLCEGDPWCPLYYALAVVVAASRVHVKIHHASDVIAGAAIGVALGAITRQLVPVEPFRARRAGRSEWGPARRRW